jgi:hypothetical protein
LRDDALDKKRGRRFFRNAPRRAAVLVAVASLSQLFEKTTSIAERGFL